MRKHIELSGILTIFFECQEYMRELNDTGSFPDESEKTPMCYLKCFLESVGAIDHDDKVDKTKTTEIFVLDNEDLVDDCTSDISKLLNR